MSSTSTTWSAQGNTKAGATVTSTDALTTGTLTADTIQLSSNIIKASDGGSTITLDTSDNVTIAGDLTVSGNNLTFGNGEAVANTTDGKLAFTGGSSYEFTNSAGSCKMHLRGTTNDAGLILYNHTGVGAPEWSICFDDDDSDTLKFDAGTATVGGATKLSLTESGNMTIAGDLTISGGNITNALTLDSTLTVTNTSQLNNTLTVGVDDTGYDVTFFGATSGKKLLWDESADELILVGNGTKLSFYDAAGGENISADASGVLSIAGGAEIDLTSVIVDINATTTCTIDNTNTSNGVAINTATSGGTVSIGHTTSETTINDNLSVTGNATVSGGITTQAMLWGAETVAAGNGSGSPTALSLSKVVSFVTTATNSSHVSLADGNANPGQIKIIIHKTRSNSVDLVVTPANFAAGSTLTSNTASRGVMLIFDGTNWQVMGGEITGTAEFAID